MEISWYGSESTYPMCSSVASICSPSNNWVTDVNMGINAARKGIGHPCLKTLWLRTIPLYQSASKACINSLSLALQLGATIGSASYAAQMSRLHLPQSCCFHCLDAGPSLDVVGPLFGQSATTSGAVHHADN